MQQSDIGNPKLAPEGEFPKPGYRLRDFSLLSAAGTPVSLSDYRGRSSLVLALAGDLSAEAGYFEVLANSRNRIKEQDGELLVLVQIPGKHAPKLAHAPGESSIVLIDRDGAVGRQMGASRSHPAIYVTDRFGEVAAAWRTAAGQALPRIGEILDWLEYLDSVCPECEPPEWPAT